MKSIFTSPKSVGLAWRGSVSFTLSLLFLSVVAFAKTPNCTPPTVSISGNLNLCGASVLGSFESTTLSATSNGGASFAWSNGSTGASITPSTPGTYTVTATIAAGCTASTSVTVRGISPTTGGTIGYNEVVCGIPGTPSTIVSIAPASGQPAGYVIEYVWITTTDINTVNGTASNITMIPGATSATYSPNAISVMTWYRRCARTAGCGIYSAETNWVKKDPRPAATVSIAGTTVFCEGGNTTLTASGASSYVWSTGSTGAAILVTNAGIYTVTATNSDGCTKATSVQVTVNPKPVVTISGNLNLCDGAANLAQATTLTASGGGTYLWSTGATTASISTNTAGNYTVTVTSAAGCTATKSVTVRRISPTNPGSIGYSESVCGASFDPANIVSIAPASGQPTGMAIEYVWITTTDINTVNGTASNFTTIAGATGESYDPPVISVTTWYRRCARTTGCTIYSAETVWIKKELLPLPTTTITGTNVFCAGGSSTLTATGGASYVWSTGATTAAISVNAGGTYTVTATAANGCTATATRTVTVNANPTASISGATSFCAGGSTTLTAAGGGSYAWSNAAATAAISVNTANTFTVTVTSAAGCVATKSVTTTVNANPTASISGATSFCAGGSTTLTAAGGGSYAWSNGAATAAISVNTANTFTVTVTSAAGCVATKSVTTTVNANPTASISGATSFCAGGSTTLTAAGGGSYAWSNGATTAAISVNTANTFTVTVTSAAGCVATKSVTTTVNPLPTPAITGVLLICNGGTTTLTATGGASYAWSNGSATAATTVNATGVYTVTATSTYGCTATATANVTIATPPTAAINCNNAVCLGDCLTATASGGGTYVWSTGATTASVSLCPTATTTYTVTVTNQYGCTATAERTITVFPKPTAAITGGGAICLGSGRTLTATGGATYRWSNGVLTATNTVSPSTTTTYTVTVANSSGCTATASTTVVVNPIPVASITGITGICAGNSTTLTAAGGGTYLWSNAATTAAITTSAAGTYTVTVTSANGCKATASITVTVSDAPTATITGTTNICAGRSTTLTAAGGSAYLWNTGASTASINVAPVTNRTYTVTVTNIAGCTATKSVVVTPSVLTLTPMAAVTICDGQSATVGYTTAGLTYAWSNGMTTGQINVAPSNSTIYTVTATSALGCTATASVTVNVNPRPDASVEGSTICVGNTATIYANTTFAGSTYAWSTGSTDDFISVAPSTTTYYTVTITSANGCSSTASGSVVVNPLPTPSIAGTTTLCYGNSTTLTADGGATYVWSTGGTGATLVVAPTATTSYTVTVTSAAGCMATKSVTVTVNPLPVAVITGVTTICKGGTATITASGGVSYAWSNSTNSAVLAVTPSVSTYYTVTVTNGFGCTATRSQLITVNALPAIAISGTTVLCAGSTTTLTASGGATYVWSNTEQTAAITVTPEYTSTYTVLATSLKGCTATKSVTVAVNPLPTVSVNSATICAGDVATLTATSSAGVTYAWSNGSTTAAIGVSPAVNTIYTVTVTNQYGCTATAAGTVRVNGKPVVTFADYPTTICKGACTFVCAIGGGTYAWSNGGTTATISVCPTQTTTYTVTVTNSRGCTETASRTITVNELPVATISGSSAVCAGSTATLSTSGGGTYLWSNGATTASISFSPTTTQIYNVTVTSAQGCSATASRTVTVNAKPTVAASCASTVCLGATISLSATATGATIFAWSGPSGFTASTANATRANATTAMSGNYIVTATSASGCTATSSVTTTVAPCNIKVGDFVWYDADQDGVQGGSEAGIANVTVRLYNTANTLVSSTTTDAFGEYLFENVLPATYYIKFSNLPANYVFTTQNAGTANGSDASAAGVTPNFVVGTADNFTIDAGAYIGLGSVGNYVWYDADGNGVQNVAEAGVANVEVRLLDINGVTVQTTTTNSSGLYSFSVAPGTYSVSFYRAGWTLTTQTLNNATGSDPATGTGRTPNFTIAAGQNRTDIDAGFVVCTCNGGVGKTVANTGATVNQGTPSNGFSISRNSVSLYPNPVAISDLNVKITTQVQDMNAQVVVTDITGKTVITQQAAISEGTNYIRLDVNALSEGTYLVHIRSSVAQFETQKFVRIK